MTAEVGAITGELELLTRPTADGTGIEALVKYAGARDLYTVVGSPIRATSSGTDRNTHETILNRLTTPGGVEASGELPVDLTGQP